MLFATEREVGLHRRGKRIYVAVSVAADEITAIFGERIVIDVVQIVLAQRFVAPARAALVSEKKIFGNGVRLVPSPGIVQIARTPPDIVIDGFAGKMRGRDVSCIVEN